MKKKRRGKSQHQSWIGISLVAGAIIIALAWMMLKPMNSSDAVKYVYITDSNDSETLYHQLDTMCSSSSVLAFRALDKVFGYSNHIASGRYALDPSDATITTFRKLRNGIQAPVHLTIPTVRTPQRLSAELSRHLMIDSLSIDALLHDNDFCQSLGYDTTSIMAIFIPNTYDVYWNITPQKLLQRMQSECKKFWNDDRLSKAEAIGLTPLDVTILASIVDEETANDSEKSMIAGMYINRLQLHSDEYPNGMPLQADPTIKFALKDFSIRRIYHNMLSIDSPYNTYKNTGLPPGPIRIPEIFTIDAVLNRSKHDYLYMCAKEDFSGRHNFARTYSEHLANAARYAKALDQRGIKK